MAVTFASIITLVTALSLVLNAQSQGYFWWNVGIQYARQLTEAGTPTFVLYGSPDSATLRWVFKNDEGFENISLMPAEFQTAVRLNVARDGQQVNAAVVWSPAGTRHPSGIATPVDSQAVLELKPGEWVEWDASIRRNDVAVWAAGDYELTIDMTAAISTLMSNGRPWRGRSGTEIRLTLKVSEADSIASLKWKYRLAGSRALAEGRAPDAVAQYMAMVQIDPTDTGGYESLGQALIAVRQYKAAAAALEIALPHRLRGQKSTLPETLAYVYLVLRDEVNAVRVLRLVVPERDMPARLDGLRAVARRAP
jgi:hypothetical protein